MTMRCSSRRNVSVVQSTKFWESEPSTVFGAPQGGGLNCGPVGTGLSGQGRMRDEALSQLGEVTKNLRVS